MDARRRREHPPPPGRPRGRAARRDGRAARGARGPLHAAARSAGAPLRGIEYALPVASAQIKSCVLLAGLLAEGTTTIVEPEPSRDHTERLLARAGAGIARDGDRITRDARRTTLALDAIHVPGDPSSAAFHVAAAVLVPGSRLRVEGMAANWTRVGFFRILERMGAAARSASSRTRATAAPDAEPLCELEVAHGPLTGTRVTADEVPLAIDELPLVALLGCFAEGETVVEGAQELRAEGVRPDRDRRRRAARPRRRHRGDRRRLRGARHRRPARRHDRTRTATTGSRCSARSPGWRAARASRSSGWRPPRSPTPASPPIWPR